LYSASHYKNALWGQTLLHACTRAPEDGCANHTGHVCLMQQTLTLNWCPARVREGMPLASPAMDIGERAPPSRLATV